MMLDEFVSYLYARGMVDASKIPEDSDEGYANRMKIQNYAFLARLFGLDMGYIFDGHLNGPYSQDMTKDHDLMDTTNTVPVTAPKNLREKEFLAAVDGKSSDWLEIAASIIQITDDDPETTLIQMYSLKCFHTPEFIDSVYRDLEAIGLMQIPKAS